MVAVQDEFEGHRVNGILGMRMVWSHVRALHTAQNIGIKAFADMCFPDAKYIFVKRDPWRQAIESTISQDASVEKIPFQKIKGRVRNILIGYQAWEDYFERFGICPLRVRSEDFQASPETACHEIYGFLGIPYPPDAKLKNTFDDQWTTHRLIDAWYKRCVGGLLPFMGAKDARFD